jgi:hypothetical protein
MARILPRPMSEDPAPEPLSRTNALIRADAILNILRGYPRKGSRVRHNSYQRDLNWLADVLLAVAGLSRRRLCQPE